MSIDEQTRVRDYHNEIRAERDKLREKLEMAKEIIDLYVDPMNVRPEHNATIAAISDH
jgi:hypothetical protein